MPDVQEANHGASQSHRVVKNVCSVGGCRVGETGQGRPSAPPERGYPPHPLSPSVPPPLHCELSGDCMNQRCLCGGHPRSGGAEGRSDLRAIR